MGKWKKKIKNSNNGVKGKSEPCSLSVWLIEQINYSQWAWNSTVLSNNGRICWWCSSRLVNSLDALFRVSNFKVTISAGSWIRLLWSDSGTHNICIPIDKNELIGVKYLRFTLGWPIFNERVQRCERLNAARLKRNPRFPIDADAILIAKYVSVIYFLIFIYLLFQRNTKEAIF